MKEGWKGGTGWEGRGWVGVIAGGDERVLRKWEETGGSRTGLKGGRSGWEK